LGKHAVRLEGVANSKTEGDAHNGGFIVSAGFDAGAALNNPLGLVHLDLRANSRRRIEL
jgi:hypothetical protein